MKRKLIATAVAVLILGSLAYMGFGIIHRLKKKEFVKGAISSISFEKVEFLGDNSLNKNRAILILFHPDCDFCQTDAEMIRKEIVLFREEQLLFVSYDNKNAISNFSQVYNLDNYPNVHFAYMDIETMLERYGNVRFPTFLAYNEYGELVKKWVGLTKPQEILKAYSEAKR